MLKQSSLFAAAVAGLFAAAAAPTLAQDYPRSDPQASASQASEVITVRPTDPVRRRFYMTKQDVAEVRGEYLMEDGRTATVENKNRRLVIDFDNRITELQATGAYVFESDRDDMTLVYTKDGLGDDVIVLSYIPQQTVAGVVPQRVMLSSR
jgi:hypothetical protein